MMLLICHQFMIILIINFDIKNYAALEHKEAVMSNYLLAVNCPQNKEEDGEISESFTTTLTSRESICCSFSKNRWVS